MHKIPNVWCVDVWWASKIVSVLTLRAQVFVPRDSPVRVLCIQQIWAKYQLSTVVVEDLRLGIVLQSTGHLWTSLYNKTFYSERCGQTCNMRINLSPGVHWQQEVKTSPSVAKSPKLNLDFDWRSKVFPKVSSQWDLKKFLPANINLKSPTLLLLLNDELVLVSAQPSYIRIITLWLMSDSHGKIL